MKHLRYMFYWLEWLFFFCNSKGILTRVPRNLGSSSLRRQMVPCIQAVSKQMCRNNEWAEGYGLMVEYRFDSTAFRDEGTLSRTNIHRPEIFLSPEPEVTWGTVAIIISIRFTFPIFALSWRFCVSIHYNQSINHTAYILTEDNNTFA